MVTVTKLIFTPLVKNGLLDWDSLGKIDLESFTLNLARLVVLQMSLIIDAECFS